MNYISADGISKAFGERVLFEDVTLGVGQGQKIALVGVNGSGKSTLLKVLANAEVPDSGEVVVNKNVKVAYLEQTPSFETDNIFEAVLAGNTELASLIKSYEYHLQRAETDDGLMEKLTELIYLMDKSGAWTVESQIKEILGKLGIHDLNQSIGEMSGGQKKRVALARTLMEKPDLAILDEPTNHLDLEAVEWLESYLAGSHMAIVMVTHDRYFLENVTNEIVELADCKLYNYSGSYSYYLEKKAERGQVAMAEKEKATNLYKKELEWIRRQPKARGTKAKYRVDAFEEVKKKAHVSLNSSRVSIDVGMRRQGKKILEIEGLSKSFGTDMIIDAFSYIFKRGEKLGIVGHNGSGKSTFLNLITGGLAPDEGTIESGQSTVFGYYDQSEPEFMPGNRVIDVIREVADVIDTGKEQVSASQLLTRFNFDAKSQYDYTDNLSGGEKRRLQLLKVLISMPNFLILDEPTNDLDLITLRTLEEFLHDFTGCLVIVSHDRYFMDRLTDHLFIFRKGSKIEVFNGNYSSYRKSPAYEQKKNEKTINENSDNAAGKIKTNNDKKLSFNEKRELDQLETAIEQLTLQKQEIEEKLNSGETDHKKITQWSTLFHEIKTKLDEKELRWLEALEN